MFFDSAKDASLQARIETQRTGYVHQVVACKKYLCYPKEYFGKDYINGIAKFLGNGNFMDFSAQGLDIFDIDEKNVMHKACSDIARLADGF